VTDATTGNGRQNVRRASLASAPARSSAGRGMLCIRHSALRRGRTVVLEAGELIVPRGARVAVIGANGAGKSTLMLHLAGAAGSRSQIVIRAPDGSAWKPGERTRAFAPQQPAFPTWLTVAGIAELYGFRLRRLGEAVPGMRLAEFATTRAGALSTGQAQALGFSLAIASGAELILLDEPLAPLDFRRRVAARDALSALQPRELLLFSSQSAGDVVDICDWILVFNRGRCVYCGSIGELLRRPAPVFGNTPAEVLEREIIARLESTS
jgi:ABC-2 type transport system ATP-binding protein